MYSHLKLLSESRRILIVGSPDSGKAYYAGRLAENVVNVSPHEDRKSRCVILR